MKRISTLSFALAFALGSVACQRQEAQLPAPGQPAATTQSDAKAAPALTPEQVTQRAVQRRAVEVVNWGMPAVNFDLMYQAAVIGRVFPTGRTRPSRPIPTPST